MKILHISTYLGGGAGRAALRLHQGLISNGIDSKFLYLNDEVARLTRKKATKIQRIQSLVIRIKRKVQAILRHKNSQSFINTFSGNYEIFTHPKTVFDITQHPLYKEADIIHLHWVSDFIDIPSFFKYNQKPVVWTLHDMNPIQGGFHYYEDVIKNPELTTIEAKYRQIKYEAVRNSDLHVVGLSKWLLNVSTNSQVLGKFPHSLIPNGVNTSIFKPYNKNVSRQIFNLPKEKKIVLFVSENLSNRRKGFDLLLEAICEFENKNDSVLFCAVGNNDTESVRPDKIHYIGAIHDERLMALLYSAADVFVLPSREDNLPNVMLESLACGTPVVATPVGGITDVIKPSVNGVLASNVSGIALHEALYGVLSHLENFNPITVQQSILNNYTIELQASRFINLYSDILSDK